MTAAERIVVETNTIVSGILLPRSVPGRLLSFVAEHGTFVFSAATRDELLHVIARAKFDRYVSAEARERAVVILVRDSEIVVPRRSFQICRDSKGRHFVKTTITISSRGVITLPAKLRQALGLKAEVVEARRNLATKGSAAVAAFEASLLRVGARVRGLKNKRRTEILKRDRRPARGPST